MTWLIVAVAAYLLLAVSATIDKLLMSGRVSHPAVLTFFVSALNILALALIPFGIVWLPAAYLFVSLVAGFLLTAAILFLFISIVENEATRVAPFISAAVPLMTVTLAYIFLGERFNMFEWAAFAFLIFATLMASANMPGGGPGQLKNSHNLLLASLFFTVSYLLTKIMFEVQPFLSVFLWSRMGSFVGGLMLLAVPSFRAAISRALRKRIPAHETSVLFIAGQSAGAGGVFLVNYAISLGSVSLVNALQGLQQVFLLGIVYGLHRRWPHLMSEDMRHTELMQKVASIILVFLGLVLLAIGSVR